MNRFIAEWEKQEVLQLVFPHKNTDWNEYLNEAIDTFVNIAKTIQKYQKVLIVANELNKINNNLKIWHFPIYLQDTQLPTKRILLNFQ